MAKSMTKTTRGRKPKAEAEVVEQIAVADAEMIEPKKAESKTKTYKDTDLIPCRSIITGELLVEGQKSKALYRWADYGYVEYMEYRDLLYDMRSASNSFSNKPCFIIEDEELVAQNPKISALYATLYTNGDFEELLSKDVATIKRIVPTLPKSARESLKSFVATQIRNGNLDSMNKVRAFDEIFDTNMATVMLQG